jgi:hypothetical protein
MKIKQNLNLFDQINNEITSFMLAFVNSHSKSSLKDNHHFFNC